MEDKTNEAKEIDNETFTNLIETEEIPKFSQICRVCLCETNEGDQKLNTKIHLLNNAQEIRIFLEQSTGVHIGNLEFLPNHICDRCFKTLIAWYRFRSQTQRSNEIFNQYLKKLSTSSLESKSLPGTDLTIHIHGEKMDLVSTENVSQIQDFQISFVKNKPEVVGFVFHCSSCTMTFTNQLGLDKHQQEHSKPSKQKSIKCEHCPKSFAFRNGLHHHLKFSHHLARYKYQCNICSRQYNSPTAFKAHTSKPCVPVDIIEQCKTQKLDMREEELLAIAEKTIRETKLSCILCKKNFKSNKDFIGHYPKHKKDKKCHICNKDFPHFKFLEMHVRVHLNAKVYACPMCSRSFYTPAAFRIHMKEHGKREWVYRCYICQKEFLNVREFNTHMVKHFEDMENEKKALENENVVEIENNKTIEIANECNSNAPAEDDLRNKSTYQMETDSSNCQETFELVKEEIDLEKDPPNKPQGDTFIQNSSIDFIDSKQELQLSKIGSQVQTISPLETEIPIEHESYNQSSQLQGVDNNQFNINSTELKTKISDLKDIVKLEKPESDNHSSEEENVDAADNDISSLLSNDQTSENQSSEYTQELLEKCKVNCHIANCQTKCSGLIEIWEHLEKVHLYGKKPFKCSECVQKFREKRAFRSHIKQHYTFQCPVCFKIKVSSSELKKHVIFTHSNERPFKCSQCDQSFSRPLALKVHETTHNNKKEFVCSICSKDFFSYNGLYLHLKSHKDIKELQCPNCSRQLSSKHRLKRHIDRNSCSAKNIKFSAETIADEEKDVEDMSDVVEFENPNNECDPITSAEDDSKNESTYQMETDISNCQGTLQSVKLEEESEKYAPIEKVASSQIEMDSNSTYQLETDHGSSNQSLQSAPEVKTEISTPKDIVKFENPEVDNSSSEEDNADESEDDISVLSKSNEKISEDQSAEYTRELFDKCKVNCHISGCQTKCSNLNQVWEHFKKEHFTGKQPLKCSICLEEFEHLMSFRLHIKKYYSFKCPICFKLKINSCELKRHVRLVHSNERPFKCSKCPKQFVSSCYLKAHERSHSGRKEFICSICLKGFFSKDGLYKHLNSHKIKTELQCLICSRQFLSKDHLKRHIEINTCSRKCTE